METIKCPNCGAEIDKSKSFCTKCGTRLNYVLNQSNGQNLNNTSIDIVQEDEKPFNENAVAKALFWPLFILGILTFVPSFLSIIDGGINIYMMQPTFYIPLYGVYGLSYIIEFILLLISKKEYQKKVVALSIFYVLTASTSILLLICPLLDFIHKYVANEAVWIVICSLAIATLVFSIVNLVYSLIRLSIQNRTKSKSQKTRRKFAFCFISLLLVGSCVGGAFYDFSKVTNVIKDNEFVFVNGRNRSDVEEVVIPEGVTKISKYALRGCSHLKRITIPNSVTYIEDMAFSDCRSLEEIKLPENLTHIGYSAFSHCTSLKEIIIPSKVEHIEDRLFVCCSNLT